MTDAAAAIADTRRWLERAVIGLNLCPFAKGPLAKGLVHFAVSEAVDAERVLDDVSRELEALAALDPSERETTLLIVAHAFGDFLDFNDFIGDAEALLRRRGLEGVLQLASFHPQFQFAGTDADDVTNCTNRSPYPIVHLLREESIDRAVAAFPDPAAIYEANMALLQRLGREGWDALGVGPTP
jgi:hypothetical protein